MTSIKKTASASSGSKIEMLSHPEIIKQAQEKKEESIKTASAIDTTRNPNGNWPFPVNDAP